MTIKPVAWRWEDEHGCVYVTGDERKDDVPERAIALCRHDEAMAEIERLRALVSSSEAERYRVCGKLNLENYNMRAELDVRVGDLVMLRRAIEEGDPKYELLFRVDDMLRETRSCLDKHECEPNPAVSQDQTNLQDEKERP